MGVKPRYTWIQAVNKFITETKHKRSHQTDLQMLGWLHTYVGGMYINDITADTVSTVKAACLAEGRATGTVNRYLAVLRGVLIMARDDWQWLDKVPKVKLFPEATARVRFLSHAEMAALFKELAKFQYMLDLVEFTLHTGLRHENLITLEWSKVHPNMQHIWVNPIDSKNAKAIAVPLNAKAREILVRQLGKHPTRVFTNKGKPVTDANSGVWKRALKRAGINNFRWHDLRHTWASYHVMNGTSLLELKELGCWSSLRMVERYAHLNSDHLQRVCGNLDNVYNLATVPAKENLVVAP